MKEVSIYRKIDRVLIETASLVKLNYIWPVNEEEEKQKEDRHFTNAKLLLKMLKEHSFTAEQISLYLTRRSHLGYSKTSINRYVVDFEAQNRPNIS